VPFPGGRAPGAIKNERNIATSPFGSDKADARIYGSSRFNGSFPGVIGGRSEENH